MERIPLLDLKAQYAPLKETVEREVRAVMDSQMFVLGETVERFEQECAAYTGAAHAIGCASGTDALILALAALGVGPGDRVLTTPFSFFSTASCAYKVGARPAFADIDEETYNLDPQAAEAALALEVRALIPVHLFGQSADMDAFLDIAERRGVAIVEDAAQALGANYESARLGGVRHVGTMGEVGCYSFFPTKNLGCFGDGGMLVTSDDALADKLRVLRVHGGRQMYHHRWVGWNSRLDALQAAVLSVKLPHLDSWSRGRRANAELYDRLFTEAGLIKAGCVRLPGRSPYARHIFNQYTLRVERRDALREHLNQHGIGQSVYYPVPLHLQECFADLGYREGEFPRTERACREVISLPIYPELERRQIERVAETIAQFYGAA